MSKYKIDKDLKELEHRIQSSLEDIKLDKQVDIKVLGNCRIWVVKWNDFILSDKNGKELLKVRGLTLTYSGWLDNNGNKDASVFVGGRIEDLDSFNWNLCMSVSIKTSDGVFVGIAVTDGAIILKNKSHAVAGHGFPVDQTHANLWYDSIGQDLVIVGKSPIFSATGIRSGIPASCESAN